MTMNHKHAHDKYKFLYQNKVHLFIFKELVRLVPNFYVLVPYFHHVLDAASSK